jgi:hypothetical protein
MDFSNVPPPKWQPVTASQKAKYQRLTSMSQPLPTTNMTPADCNLQGHMKYRVRPVPTDDQVAERKEASRRLREKRTVVESEIRKGMRDGVLDGFMVLEGCGADPAKGNLLPDEGRHCDVSGRGLGSVDQEDLTYYTRLSFMDAGDNALGLAMFAPLPRLQELRLHCNGITTAVGLAAAVAAGGFANLTTLDLSYNALSVSEFGVLSVLPALTELDVT